MHTYVCSQLWRLLSSNCFFWRTYMPMRIENTISPLMLRLHHRQLIMQDEGLIGGQSKSYASCNPMTSNPMALITPHFLYRIVSCRIVSSNRVILWVIEWLVILLRTQSATRADMRHSSCFNTMSQARAAWAWTWRTVLLAELGTWYVAWNVLLCLSQAYYVSLMTVGTPLSGNRGVFFRQDPATCFLRKNNGWHLIFIDVQTAGNR